MFHVVTQNTPLRSELDFKRVVAFPEQGLGHARHMHAKHTPPPGVSNNKGFSPDALLQSVPSFLSASLGLGRCRGLFGLQRGISIPKNSSTIFHWFLNVFQRSNSFSTLYIHALSVIAHPPSPPMGSIVGHYKLWFSSLWPVSRLLMVYYSNGDSCSFQTPNHPFYQLQAVLHCTARIWHRGLVLFSISFGANVCKYFIKIKNT